MACGTNAYVLTRSKSEEVLPHLTYLRVNISAGEPKRYAEIMGVKEDFFHRVVENIKHMTEIKKRDRLGVTIGLQMVLMPQYADQIIPLAKLGKELGVDYLVIKHCSDNENGDLGVDYRGYSRLGDLLHEAESYSNATYQCTVKWSKIQAQGTRSYQRCYGAPFLLQISGSGLVAPCGMLFNEKYKKFHIGNICEQSFKEIWKSDRYWEVMNYLASPEFNAQKMCGSLCLQHKVNEALDEMVKGRIEIERPQGKEPQHLAFVWRLGKGLSSNEQFKVGGRHGRRGLHRQSHGRSFDPGGGIQGQRHRQSGAAAGSEAWSITRPTPTCASEVKGHPRGGRPTIPFLRGLITFFILPGSATSCRPSTSRWIMFTRI